MNLRNQKFSLYFIMHLYCISNDIFNKWYSYTINNHVYNILNKKPINKGPNNIPNMSILSN